MAGVSRVSQFFAYSYSQDLTAEINAIRERVMGPMPERSEWINDEVHTTSVFVGTDRHLNADERMQVRDELHPHVGSSIEFRITGVARGERNIIFLKLDAATPASASLDLGAYRAIFGFMERHGFTQTTSFASPDRPPPRYITLSWVPADRVEEYLQRFQNDEGVKALCDRVVKTRSFRLICNDSSVSDIYNIFD